MPHRQTPIALALALALTLAGCAHSVASVVATTPAHRYARAIVDASEPTEAEISTSLLAITASTTSLVWDGERGAGTVHVVTWTNWDGYDEHVGETVPLGREVWVTAVPDLQDRCRALATTGEALVARLEAMLGLPPASQKTRFVELAVAPSDMFRPCPDAEVTDQACTLAFPSDASAEHRTWIDALRLGSYGEGGYPWTQLGYTYDWGVESSHVGPSEFVVRRGASARIVAVAPTDAYCASSAPAVATVQ